MEVGRHRRAPLRRDVGRQIAVGAAHPRKRVALHRRIEMHDLVQRMHASIGAAGTHGGDLCIGKGRQRAFQVVLHGVASRLALPALVRGPAVTHAQGPTARSGWRFRSHRQANTADPALPVRWCCPLEGAEAGRIGSSGPDAPAEGPSGKARAGAVGPAARPHRGREHHARLSSMLCALVFSAPPALATTSSSRSRAPSMSPIWRNSSANSSLRASGSFSSSGA